MMLFSTTRMNTKNNLSEHDAIKLEINRKVATRM